MAKQLKAILLAVAGYLLAATAYASTVDCMILSVGTPNRADQCSVEKIGSANHMLHYSIRARSDTFYIYRWNCPSIGSSFSCRYKIGTSKSAKGDYADADVEDKTLSSPDGQFTNVRFQCFKESGGLHLCLEEDWE